jgi:integrase
VRFFHGSLSTMEVLWNSKIKKKIMKRNQDIRLSFYLKSTSKNSQRKAVYANIRYSGEAKQFATGVYCEDPDNEWARGGFIGQQRKEDQAKLLEIINTIEGFDSHNFRDVDQIWDMYQNNGQIKTEATILEAFDWALEELKENREARTYEGNKSSVNTFKDFIDSNKKINSDFSIIRKNPRQMFRKHAMDYRKFLKIKGNASSTIHIRLSNLKALYNSYFNIHSDMFENMISNPFVGISKQADSEDRKKNAIERALPWAFIEEIKKISFSNKKHEQYRALAIFQAYTGISFKDLGKKDVLKITQTMKGKSLIGKRAKTGKDYLIDITLAEDSLKKLNAVGGIPFDPFVNEDLSYISASKANTELLAYNTFLNDVLSKEIDFEWNDRITSHKFRHTFGMTALNEWKIDIHILAEMMGDEVKTILETYANLTKENVLEQQRSAFNKFLERKEA